MSLKLMALIDNNVKIQVFMKNENNICDCMLAEMTALLSSGIRHSES